MKRGSRFDESSSSSTSSIIMEKDEDGSEEDHKKKPYPSIFRAPTTMRRVDSKTSTIYDPELVAIGPFHCNSNNPALAGMKEQKQRFAMRICKSHGERNISFLKNALKHKNMEERSRECYSESFDDISKEEFLNMLVLDACFVLELFRNWRDPPDDIKDDPIFRTRWMLPVLWLDLLKLENQIPFFVLEEVHLRTKLPGDTSSDVKSLAQDFLSHVRLQAEEILDEDICMPSPIPHILGLFHSMFKSSSTFQDQVTNVVPRGERRFLPCTSDLGLSGTKFKKGKGKLLDIEYKRDAKAIEIPILVVDNCTTAFMRNMVAYEQCDYKKIPSHFTSYTTFLDALVKSPKDAEVLRVAGVIDHYLSSTEKVSALLSSLTAGIDSRYNEGYLSCINSEICVDYNKPLAQWKVWVRRFFNIHTSDGVNGLMALYTISIQIIQGAYIYASNSNR